MEHEALAQRELKEYLMRDPDYRRLAELQQKVSHTNVRLCPALTHLSGLAESSRQRVL